MSSERELSCSSHSSDNLKRGDNTGLDVILPRKSLASHAEAGGSVGGDLRLDVEKFMWVPCSKGLSADRLFSFCTMFQSSGVGHESV